MNSKSCNAAFKKKILTICYDCLEGVGFKRFRKESVDFLINDNFSCWVGLNTGLYPDLLDIEPFVGLHVTSIDKLVSELDDGEYAVKYNRAIATYALHLNDLEDDKDKSQFAFSPLQSDDEIEAQCRNLALLYSTLGLNYAKSIANYQSLASLLKARTDMLGGYPESYACCLYLMGKKIEAKEFLNNVPKQDKEFISGFSTPFIKMIDAEV